MATLLIHAWTVHKEGDTYYLPYTHWIYLKEIANYYDAIGLLSPVKETGGAAENGLLPISDIGPITVHPLPYSDGYIAAIRHVAAYKKAYRQLSYYHKVYVRYPVPFGWLSKLYFKKRIIHFVGDPIDAARTNPNFSTVKKTLLITFFMPEHLAYMWACRGAAVFTNGYPLKKRLSRYGVTATALISSTLQEKDFYFEEDKKIDAAHIKLLYVGYLRKAKGVEVLIKALQQLITIYPHATLTIAGSGEFEQDLKALVQQSKLEKQVTFLGHIENRDRLNELLRSHDIFCFASLSEGSPRVVLEAMANGLAVVSTPVGSLPTEFREDQDLLFASFNNAGEFCEKIVQLVKNNDLYQRLRRNAFAHAKNLTIESFIKRLFE